MPDLTTNNNYSIATGSNTTNPFVIHFSTRDPTSHDVNYPVQKQWVNTASNKFWILSGFTTTNGVITADWLLFPSGSSSTETLTGNSGGAVGPDGSSNINVMGDGTTITIAGNAGSHTLTASLIGSVSDQFTADTGTATPSAGNINLSGGTGISTSASGSTVTFNSSTAVATSYVTNSGTATPSSHTLHVVGDGTNITTSGSGNTVTVSFSGSSVVETLTGNTGGAISPSANNINVVGDGSTVSVAGSGHTLTISAMGNVPITFDGNTGTATPSGGVISILGAGSLTTVASGSQVLTELTGLTNHAVLVGNGSTTITKVGPTATSGQVLQSQGSSADPAFSTATYPSTTTANDLLYSSSTNVVGQITTANNAVLTTNASGVPSWTTMAADGDLLIGSSAGAPAAATLTAGTGISITNGHNSITIANTGTTFSWHNVMSSSQAMTSNNGYMANNGTLCTLILPTTSSFGDTISIVGYGAGGWAISQGSGQQVIIGINSSTLGASGTVTSSNQYDSITLLCAVANTIWVRINSAGNIGTS